MNNTKQRFLGAHVKAVSGASDSSADAPHGWVEGIANAFEVDRYGDLVLPTALAASFQKFLLNPVLSFGHGIEGNPANGTLPAGKVLSLSQDASGNTTFRAAFAPTEDAQKVRQLYAEGFMRAFSIHFLPYGDSLQTRQPTAEEVERFPGVQRVITALELIEIACAVVPVNAGSLMSGAKSLNSRRLATVGKLKRGAKSMKTILSGEQKKSVEKAAGAYEAHADKLEALKSHLEELSASEGEADHNGMAAKCHAAMKAVGESHGALNDAVKAMHVAITNQDPEDEGDGSDPDAGGDGDGEGDGSAPLPEDGEAKAIAEAFRKGFKA